MPLSIKVKANKNIFGIYANGGWRLHNHKLLSFPPPVFALGNGQQIFGLGRCFGYCPVFGQQFW